MKKVQVQQQKKYQAKINGKTPQYRLPNQKYSTCYFLRFTSQGNDSAENLFKKQSTFIQPRNRDGDLDNQNDVMNNLNLQKMETKAGLKISVV